jgi:hypothetical protein
MNYGGLPGIGQSLFGTRDMPTERIGRAPGLTCRAQGNAVEFPSNNCRHCQVFYWGISGIRMEFQPSGSECDASNAMLPTA